MAVQGSWGKDLMVNNHSDISALEEEFQTSIQRLTWKRRDTKGDERRDLGEGERALSGRRLDHQVRRRL